MTAWPAPFSRLRASISLRGGVGRVCPIAATLSDATMASADSCPALTVQVSPSKVFKLSTRFVRLYLLLLSLTLGFRVCLHTPRQQAASLPVRVPTTVSLLIASFGALTSRPLALLFATVAVTASDQFLS